jgi:hypothetical protein
VIRINVVDTDGCVTGTMVSSSDPALREPYRELEIKTPLAFKLDELPEPVEIKSPYGTLRTSWTAQDDEIVLEETLEILETQVPQSEYAKVREFFELVAGARSAPVVLLKQ